MKTSSVARSLSITATALVVLLAAAPNISAQVAGVAFTTQPGAATANMPFGQPAVLQTVDGSGTPTTAGLPAVMIVNVALTNSAGALGGTTSYNIGTSGSNGTVTLTDLAVSTAGSGNKLIAWIGAATPPVAGAALWLDANDAASLTVNGTAVSAWNNKGSIGSALTQANAASQPTLTAGALSGKPVVTFNGTSSHLLSLNSAYNNSGNQMTYFCVTRLANNAASWRGPVSFSANGQVDGWGAAGVVILTDGTSGNQLSIQRHHQGTPLQATIAPPAANTAFVMTFADNVGNASLSYLDANGATKTNTANIINGVSPYTYGITDVAVGGRLEPSPTLSANYWPGAVAEVLVYNTALTAAERAAVQNYLANKWFNTLAPSSALSAAFTVIPGTPGPVAGLAFTTSPGSASAGSPFGQQPVLKTVDQFGTPSVNGLPATLTITVALASGSGTLSGTTTYNIGTTGGNGTINFTDLAISAAGSSNQLIASVGSTASNSIAGAALWLDAADPSTLTLNGTLISSWANKGSGGSALTQANAGSQPAITYNSLNGKPVLTFNGGSSYLASFNSAYNNSGSQMTYFVVTRLANNGQSWRGPVSFSANGQVDGWGVSGVVILTDGTSANQLSIQRHHQGTPLQALIPPPAQGTAFAMTFVDDAGTASLYYTDANGGTQANTTNIVNGVSPYTYGITDVAVGGRLEPDPAISANYWPGDVAEVLVYNTALSAEDRNAVENYLKAKWFGIGGGTSLNSGLSSTFTVSSGGGNPPRQNITSTKVNGDGSVTLTYLTTSGFNYHVEVSPTVTPGSWTTIAGSTVAGTGGAVTFTDTTSIGNSPRFYRTVSP